MYIHIHTVRICIHVRIDKIKISFKSFNLLINNYKYFLKHCYYFIDIVTLLFHNLIEYCSSSRNPNS